MNAIAPSIEFFDGIYEQLDDVSLRQDRSNGDRIVLLRFKRLKSIEQFKSYTNRFSKALRLSDDEGKIEVQPDGIKFIFGGPEGDDLRGVECKFAIQQEDHWNRFMRFMQRYADANGMAYGEHSPNSQAEENAPSQ
ncbi:MAG: photosystem II reaction center protein Psb28 [Leptolyngbyaceae bacterium]|nr:photosystem II reaction center protein Psb28 [Leptolyngbyaceae bacterium]